MPLPALIPLALKLLPLAGAVPEVIRALGGDKAADAAERIVGVAKAITGQQEPEKAVEAVLADPNLQLQFQQTLSAERVRFAEIAAEAEKHAGTQVTERWQADMASDSSLSKNIRPMTLIYLLTVYTLFGMMSAFGYSVNEAYVTLLGQWGMLIMSAYFVGRTVEKAIQMKQ